MSLRTRVRRFGLMLAMVAATIAAPACRSGEDPAAPAEGQPVPVTVTPAKLETLRDVLERPGIIVPAAATDWSVTAPEPARIAELPKAEGDAVQPGDLLVRLELPSVTESLATLELEIGQARMKVMSAKAELAKLAPLNERGIISRNQWDAANAAVASAETALAEVENKRENTKQMAERANIHARFPGIVIKRFHTEGEFVAGTPTDTILRVIDPNKVQVSVQVPVGYLSRIVPGLAATVISGGGPPEPATVASRQLPTDAQSPSTEIRLGFSSATALTIDALVQIEMVVDERRDVITVPSSVVRRDDSGTYVMVAGDDGLAHRRDVRAGLISGASTQIVSGLVVGERVISTSLDQISDGTKIAAR